MPVYTVSQITQYVKESLEMDSLLADLWISAEVSNLRSAPSGHSYFTLKDSHSQLRTVMFKGGRGSELLSEGGLVMAHGRISFYVARGDVQLVADLVMPEGTGPLFLQLEKLKMRLEEEGLFETSRKRPLPRFPRVIGVVNLSHWGRAPRHPHGAGPPLSPGGGAAGTRPGPGRGGRLPGRLRVTRPQHRWPGPTS